MRRAVRITAWTVGALLLLVVALSAAVLIAGNTARGRALLEQATARATHGHVRLAELAGSFPTAIDLGQLQLSDTRGVWLTAEHISLRWSPLALLTRHVNVESLRVARLDIERRPVSQPAQPGGGGMSLPRIDVQQLSIGTLQLGAELAGAPASLSIHGSMHLTSLEDAAAAVVVRRTGGNGDYELRLSFDPARMDATLRLEEPAGGPLANLLQYPELGALSVMASLHGPRAAERIQLTARAGELRAGVQGSIDLIRRSANLDYRLDAPAMTARPGLSWQRIALQGRWQGAVTAPQANGRLQIDALKIPGGAALATLNADLHADRGTLALRATAAGVVLPGPQPRVLADSALRVDARVQLNAATRPLQLTADHRLFALQVSAVTAGARSATFDLRLPDLAPLAALAGQKMRGRSELKGTLGLSSTTTRLDLEANTVLAGGATQISALLAGASRLQLAAVLTDRTVELQRLALNGRALSVSASGSAQRGTVATAAAVQSLRARYEADLANLAVLSPALAGTLKLNGEIGGPRRSLTAQLQLTSSLSVRGSPRETIEASIEARGLPSRVSATLQAQGRFAGAPLQLAASLERDAGDALHLVVQRSQWKSASLEGDLTSGANLASGHGSVRLRVAQLADLQPLLGIRIEGSIAGDLALRPAAGRTYAQARLEARNIVAGGVSANARLTASGPSDALALQLAVQSPDVGGEPASLDSSARLNFAARELGVQQAQLHYHGQSVRLLSPARLSFAAGFAIRGLRLGAQRSTIELDGSISPELDLRASVDQVDAALVNAFVPNLLAQGTLEAHAQLQGTSSAPTGLVTLNATAVRLANSKVRDLAALNVQARVRLTAGAAQLDARLSAGGSSQLALTGTAPFSADGVLNLKLTGKLDAAVVNPLLEAHGERAAGTLALNATVSGTARSPEVAGTIDVTHGDLRDYAQGAHLSDITAHLAASQGVLRIVSLSARASPGELSMTGTVGVLQPQMPVDVQLTAKNAQPITSDLLTSNLSGALKLHGTLRERMEVSGRIDLNRTVVGIPNALPSDIAVLDVRRPGQAPAPPSEHNLVIGLDLELHAAREVLVQGRGLNAELGGDLHIDGTTASPHVSGGFDLVRGTFTLASTQLIFTKGTVSFNGAGLKQKIDPTLDFTAESNDGVATLHITGLADAPQFELSSSPPLPQDELLARLLFGESASQLTALQLAQIGVALASLSGVGGSGPNPLAKVQKALGLDRLSVGGATNPGAAPGTQSTGAAVEAGRYVSNRVFVGATQSTTGFSQVEVDVDLTKHLKLQTRLGNGTATTQGTTPENDPGSSVGVAYQFEY
jgi:translocation and assembly module TamB